LHQAYGIYIPGGVSTICFKESMGRLPEPEGSKIFYGAFEDVLDEQSKGRIGRGVTMDGML